MKTKTLFAAVSVAVLATAIWMVWADSKSVEPSGEPAGTEDDPKVQAEEVPSSIKGTAPAATVSTSPEPKPLPRPTRLERSTEPREHAMVYPDGLMLPPLNGVTGKTKVSWPPGKPYTPVIEKQTMPDGTEWYLHEGGVWTTTFYSEFNRDGRRWRAAMGKTLLERPDLASKKK